MHPEADALLDAIIAHPDDDTPRLVYADWLQEHDYEDYAQFIRLSVKADGGSKPPRVRQQFREERAVYWERMQEHTEAFRALSLTVHSFYRGFCTEVVANADEFVRIGATCWPWITPPKLTVFDLTGREAAVVETVSRTFSKVSSLRCLSRSGMDVHDIDEYCFAPFSGRFFALLPAIPSLTRLRSLTATIATSDIPALTAFAKSNLALQLESLWIDVRFPTDDYEKVIVQKKTEPASIRNAIEAFLAVNRM